MHTLDLTHVGHGLHEELVTYAADQEGFPEQEGVHLAVRDGWAGTTSGCPQRMSGDRILPTRRAPGRARPNPASVIFSWRE